MPGHAGRLLPRKRLGAVLRRLRDDRGEQLQKTAENLLFSPSKLSRIETGQALPTRRDFRDLLDYFGVVDTETGAELVQLNAEARTPGWWEGLPMPARVKTFIEYESAAVEIRAHEHIVFPGLLQCADYAREVMTALTDTSAIEAPSVDEQVEFRLERQRNILGAASPPTMCFAFPESVLARTVGSPKIMNKQLDKLADSSEHPKIDLHVIPNSSGLYRAMEGGFTIFSFALPDLPDVVNTESVLDSHFHTGEEVVSKHRALFEDVRQKWLDQRGSRDMIITYRR